MAMQKSGFIVFLIGSLFSACSPVHGSLPLADIAGPRAWFDAPLPGTVALPPNPCQIVAHGAAPGGIALFELSINGAVSATIPSQDVKSSLVPLTQDCGLTAPGHYVLDLRAQDNTGTWSNVAETDVTIAAEEASAGTPTPTAATMPTSPTFTPTPASAAGPGAVSIDSISSDTVYLGGTDCGPVQVTITARATAPNPIQVVVLFYRFGSGAFQDVAMNPAGGDLFQRSLNPTALLGGALPSDQATLDYQVVVQQQGGDTSIRTPVMSDISVQACGAPPPASVDCSSYSTKNACESHGCNWMAKPAIVPIYVCQNP
jgi:hypothetical protein